jgi:hypothetical protein
VRPVAKLVLFAMVLAMSFVAGAALGAVLPDLGPDEPAMQQEESHP